jgi:hypothetical protein
MFRPRDELEYLGKSEAGVLSFSQQSALGRNQTDAQMKIGRLILGFPLF